MESEKKYSYLMPGGIASHYRQVGTVNAERGEWTVYRCIYPDCVENERFVGVRKHTGDILTGRTERDIRDGAYDAEVGTRRIFKYQGLGL